MVDNIRRDEIAPHTSLTADTAPPTSATVEIQYTDGTLRRVQLQHLPGGAGGGGGSTSQWRTGSGAPASGLGADGDFYLNSANGDYYGPKTSGAWGSVAGNLKGLPGNLWILGTTAPASGTGVNGDLFLNVATGDVYGPKAAGAWGAIAGSLKGRPGDPGPRGINPRGAYNALTSYAQGDVVSYEYSVAYAKQATTGNLPTNTTFWEMLFDGSQAVADALASTPRAEDSDGTVLVATMTKLREGSGISITPDPADPNRAIIAASGGVGGSGSTNLGFTRNASTVTVTSDTGADAVLPAASALEAGVMAASDKSKLDAIPGSQGVIFNVAISGAAGTPAAFVFALREEMIGSTHGFWSSVQADGGDIRVFQDTARTIRLPIHIAAFDRTAKTCVIYVRLTNALAQNGTFTVQCGVGGGSATQPAVADAYGRNAVWAGWDLVTQGFATDVTGNGALVATGTTTPTITQNGVYGLPKIAFNGTNQTVQTVDARARRGAVTIMAFVKPVSGAQGLVGYDNDLVSVDFVGSVMRRALYATTVAQFNAAFSFPADTWKHLVVRHDMASPSNQPTLFSDGASLGAMPVQGTPGAGARATNAFVISIGAWGTNGAAPFNGEMADFRQFNGLLSDAYIAATYSNMSAPASFAAASPAVNLGDVIASQAQAEAGTSNETLMTPLRVWQAIAAMRANAPETTLAALDAIGNAINTTGKTLWKFVKVPRDASIGGHRFYFAQGILASSRWTPEDDQTGLEDRVPL